MSKWKIAVSLCLTLAMLLSLTAPIGAHTEEATAPITPPPSVSAQAAILVEAQSGKVVFEKQGDLPLSMASTTKIMTALVALSLASPDTVIEVSPDAVGVEGSSVYLTAGERLTLEDLLYALLLESANDAAVAIAIGLSGSVEEFAKEMNRAAEELGLQSTQFANPHGLDDPSHYTTARELAVITQAALENDLFSEIVATKKASIPSAQSQNGRVLINHNKLLRLYDGCIGVKTGFTKKSGRCLVSAAERDGVTLIAVTINAPDDWQDHASMLDYGFSCFESVTLCKESELRLPLTLVGGVESYVLLSNAEELRVTLPVSHGPISRVVEMPRMEYAPTLAGEKQGRVLYLCDTDGDGRKETIGELPLLACYDVPKRPKVGFWQWLLSLLNWKD